MAKPLEIKRIDLLVHPFCDLGGSYGKRGAGKLFGIWKKHVDEVAKDPNRVFFVKGLGQLGKPPDREAMKSTNVLWKLAKTKELLNYAKKKLNGRFGFFEAGESKFLFYDYRGKGFKDFKEFAKAKGFAVDPETVKTRGLGEVTTACVTAYLASLNARLGLKNVIPYRNKQSTVLPRKSIGGGYPLPWRLKTMLKSRQGREKVRKMMQEYSRDRMEDANYEALGQRRFNTRTNLMKKKPMA